MSFKIDPALINNLFPRRGFLRGRVSRGRVVIENWTVKDVYQPQNVCWWDKVKKPGGSSSGRKRSPRRSK